jgi:tetratricopeptide (TPR) repeat protein
LRPAELWADRTNFVAYSYGRNTLKSLSPNSVLIMDGGDDTFYSLAYLTQVEGRRPDVQLHDRGDVVFHPLYGDDFRSLDRASKESRRQQVELALAQSARPLAYSTMNEKILPGVQLRQQGLLYQATKGRLAQSQTNLWELYDLRGIPPWSTEGSLWRIDYRLRALVPFYAFQRAIFEGREKVSQESLLFLLSALKAGPDVLWLRPNVRATLHLWAYTNLQQRKPAEAERLYQVLVAVAPEDDTAWLNLGALADQRGDLETSIHCYQQALRISPRSAKAHYNLGAVYWKQGKWSEVVREFEEALRIDPNYPSAGGFLNQALARLAGQS